MCTWLILSTGDKEGSEQVSYREKVAYPVLRAALGVRSPLVRVDGSHWLPKKAASAFPTFFCIKVAPPSSCRAITCELSVARGYVHFYSFPPFLSFVVSLRILYLS